MAIRQAIVLTSVFLVSSGRTATAQWVSFTDDTASRLILSPFADDPGGLPINDGKEKDMAVGDLNRDGLTDVVVVRKLQFSNPGARQDVLLINENGILMDRTADFAPGFITEMTDARDVFIGDFDGDGWDDVIIANTFWQQPKYYRNLRDDGKGNWLGLTDESNARFPEIVVANLPGPQFCAVWAGDVTGNGALDIYFSNYAQSGGTTDVLLINSGSGIFTDETDARLGDYANVAFGTAVEIFDVDNDGDNDIVKISTLYEALPFDARWLGILYNNGKGSFNNVQELFNAQPYMFDIGDLNGDGMLDLYHQGDQQDRVLIATSMTPDVNVTYTVSQPSPSPRTTGFGGNSKLADIDGDGDLDVGIAPVDVDIQNCSGFSAGDFALLRNDGAGGLSDPWPENQNQNIHVRPHDFAFLDVDNDGCMDILMGLCEGWRVFIQDGCDPPLPGDGDGDGDVDLADHRVFVECATGPGPHDLSATCATFDLDGDQDVDLADWSVFQVGFTGS